MGEERKFKVGDRVRVIHTDGNCYKTKRLIRCEGLILEVEEGNDPLIKVQFDGGAKEWCWPKELESAEERSESAQVNSENELSRLVRKANEGLDAIQELHTKHQDKVDLGKSRENMGTRDFAIGITSGMWKFRIKPVAKPQPTFESFKIGHDWKVGICDETKEVFVGCKQFLVTDLIEMLKDMCKYSCVSTSKGGKRFIATRIGITFETHHLSWADADKLLAALEKYQQELKECA